jgi:hypothetical protein
MKIRTFVSITAIPALLLAGTALAESPNDAPVTPATAIHGAPGNTPGFGGSSASPNGNGKNGGNGIHNIAGGAPGKAGYNPYQDKKDPAVSMHGGLRATTGTNSPLDDIP